MPDILIVKSRTLPREARTILERVERLSHVYGTAVEIKDQIGIIRAAPSN